MFTGLITETLQVTDLQRKSNCWRLVLTHHNIAWDVGESVAVDGVCLTVVSFSSEFVHFDVALATQAVTIISEYMPGRHCHIERALKVGERLGGHFVTGHVDQVAQVVVLAKFRDVIHVDFGNISPDHQALLLPKGSIAVQGVSLTINAVHAAGFSVMLIPKTCDKTCLGSLSLGDKVNLEFDMLVKAVVSQLNKV